LEEMACELKSLFTTIQGTCEFNYDVVQSWFETLRTFLFDANSEVQSSDLEIPFLCDSYKSQEQFAVFFAPLGTTYAVVNHIKNVFKHKKNKRENKKRNKRSGKKHRKNKTENFQESGQSRRAGCCFRHSGESRRCTIKDL
jgi:hypothetical protein